MHHLFAHHRIDRAPLNEAETINRIGRGNMTYVNFATFDDANEQDIR
jgi:hypothetical protein